MSKAAIKSALLRLGWYARKLRARRFPGVAVLCYHGVRRDEPVTFSHLHVTVDELEAHARLVREHCHPISLDDWRAALEGARPLPPRPVLFTFDDGYRSTLEHAVPILRRWSIPAVLFLCARPIAERRLLWYDAVLRRDGDAAVQALKDAPYDAWRAAAERSPPLDEHDPMAPLSADEVRQIAAEFEIGGHTLDHAILARASEPEQRAQLDRRLLETLTGKRVRALAYPNGRARVDYTERTVAIAAEVGYDFGFTTCSGFAVADEPPLERSRFLMLAGVGASELAHRLAYSWR